MAISDSATKRKRLPDIGKLKKASALPAISI